MAKVMPSDIKLKYSRSGIFILTCAVENISYSKMKKIERKKAYLYLIITVTSAYTFHELNVPNIMGQ